VQLWKHRLSEIPRHVLRVSCQRCERTVEIQTADAVRLSPGDTKKTGAGRVSRRLNIADPISLHLDVRMAPKYHPTPLSGGDRKALTKELGKARAMANILVTQSAEMRARVKR
jgi:hypothetical protein